MKTDHQPDPAAAVFPQKVATAVSKLKNRLQRDYEQTYPQLGGLVRIVLDEEEAKAWELSYPHLFLPDLVEAHIAQLGLKPAADTSHRHIWASDIDAQPLAVAC